MNIPGPYCLCKKHRGTSLAYRFRKTEVDVTWDGIVIETLPLNVNEIPTHEQWVEKNLPLLSYCLLSE